MSLIRWLDDQVHDRGQLFVEFDKDRWLNDWNERNLPYGTR
jgi:hypothetical protein